MAQRGPTDWRVVSRYGLDFAGLTVAGLSVGSCGFFLFLVRFLNGVEWSRDMGLPPLQHLKAALLALVFGTLAFLSYLLFVNTYADGSSTIPPPDSFPYELRVL
jgi:hypothetical protein